MSLLQVNQAKCKKDGICAAVCPLRIIEQTSSEDFPKMIAGGDELCIRCGHCVAVCPHGAMSHAAMAPDDCPPVRKELHLSAEQAEHFLRSRRSIRVYKPETVARETLTKLIDVARYAPSGHNIQPVSWQIIYDGDELRRLCAIVVDWQRSLIKAGSPMVEMLHLERVVEGWEAGIDVICRFAPHLIVTHAHKDERTAPSSSTLALAYLELAAPTFGLGACWAGYFMMAATSYPPLAEALKLPADHAVFGALMIGVPKFKYQRLVLRNEPKIIWR